MEVGGAFDVVDFVPAGDEEADDRASCGEGGGDAEESWGGHGCGCGAVWCG